MDWWLPGAYRGWGEREWKMLTVQGFLFGTMGAQLCKYTKKSLTYMLKWMICTVCALYLNIAMMNPKQLSLATSWVALASRGTHTVAQKQDQISVLDLLHALLCHYGPH